MVTYKFLVPRRGSVTAFLFGFGVLLPIITYSPFFMIQYFDLRNRVLMMSTTNVPIVLFFNTLEVLGGSPLSLRQDSLKNCIVSYAVILDCIFDPKTKSFSTVKREDILCKLKQFLLVLIGCSLIFSIMAPTFTPLIVNVAAHTTNHSLYDIVNLSHLINNFAAACKFRSV